MFLLSLFQFELFGKNNDDVSEALDLLSLSTYNPQINISEVVKSESDTGLSTYLNTVFAEEDAATDIIAASRLIDDAARFLISNYPGAPIPEMCELYLRLGRRDFYLHNYTHALNWFAMALDCSSQVANAYIYEIQSLGAIAQTYQALGDNEKASRSADEMVLKIANRVKTANNDIDKTSLIHLGMYAQIAVGLGRNELAEKAFVIAIDRMPKDWTAFQFACNNYATYLYLNGRQSEGLHYYELVNDTSLMPETISNLAIAYIQNGDMENAEKTFDAFFAANTDNFINLMAKSGESTWREYWDSLGLSYYIVCNYIANAINTGTSLVKGYNSTLLAKTMPTIRRKVLQEAFSNSENPKVRELLKEYQNLRESLSQHKITGISSGEVVNNINAVVDSLFLTEQHLAIKLYALQYEDIKESLADGEVLIEFCKYMDFSQESPFYSYAAYIIKPQSDFPQFVILVKADEINDYISERSHNEISLNQMYVNDTYIYETIWQKLLPYVEDSRKIYFSPIEQLSFINHNLIICADHSRFGDKYDLCRISSSDRIKELTHKQKDYKSAAIWGNVDYSNVSDSLISKERSGWANLNYSKTEIDHIVATLHQHNISSSIYTESNAREEYVKAMDYIAPDILHFSTHGFAFYQDADSIKRDKVQSVSPLSSGDVLMSWCGLLLSGANNVWKYGSVSDLQDDGFLTAEEISRLHLDGVKIAVLSACETGIGFEDDFGEILGLQRAFKMAGVETVMMSLWKVPDESTAMLMTCFYENLLNGDSPRESLKVAMRKVSEVFPDPYYWGAFVILD